jgi:hypothetical protein
VTLCARVVCGAWSLTARCASSASVRNAGVPNTTFQSSTSTVYIHIHRYVASRVVHREVAKFVQDFAEEVTIGAALPPWLWQGVREHAHPAIRLRHHPPLEEARTDGAQDGQVSSNATTTSTRNAYVYTTVVYVYLCV